MKRRRWTYTTREAAETAAREIGQQRDLSSTALNAILHGEIRTVEGQFGDAASYYTFAVAPRRFFNVVLVTFYGAGTNQRPHTAAYSEEWLDDEISRYAAYTPSDDLARQYREGLYRTRALVNELNQTIINAAS